jgi:ubiquinone/menaquinone biosynthesis C-methylase UbiE
MLFLGAGAAMRRQALVPIAHEVRARDQRRLRLLDIASGTGAFAREAAQAFPRLPITALDLSEPYARAARRSLGRRPAAASLVADAETLPFADASLDILTSVYLFHELPPKVRRTVIAEMARVVRPGGLVVVMDSLQDGDTPAFDGLLELFPQMFHEPYYRSYCTMDLAGAFEAAGLACETSRPVFLSKLFAFRKPQR